MPSPPVFVLNATPSVASGFLADLRSTERQGNRLRFRRNVERVGELLAYEVSKTLPYRPQTITTPLDQLTVDALEQSPVLISVLRAGLPLHQGVLNYFDRADSGFIGAYRQPTTEHDFTIEASYQALPPVAGRPLLLIDPMLATGRTLVRVLQLIAQQGTPSVVHVVSVIGSAPGVAHVHEQAPLPCSFWLGALDDHLNDQSYIVPGLGDAGDLAFGPKL
ncbi:MAG: uracil phosphoribosyltransferase [Tunicatimonas sp.]